MVDPVKLEHFRNLVSVAAADGKITVSERDALLRIATALNIPKERLDVMLAHPHEYFYLVPQNQQDKGKQLAEMIDIALIDGEFVRSEMELIKTVAQKLGFTLAEVERIIGKAISNKQ
jgi:uncharacterized tellurite resistance protein B-like protein